MVGGFTASLIGSRHGELIAIRSVRLRVAYKSRYKIIAKPATILYKDGALLSQPTQLASEPIKQFGRGAGIFNSNMNISNQLLPPEWNGLATEMSNFSCINQDAAALLTCRAFATAWGNGIQVRTPEWRDLGPSFNLGLLASGVPMPRGALMQLLGTIPETVQDASHQKELVGLEGLSACSEIFQKELRELEETLKKEEQWFAYANTLEGRMAQLSASARSLSCDSTDSTHPEAIRVRIEEARQRQAKIHREIGALIFKRRPGILVDEPEWGELAKLSENSLDRTVTALLFANGPGDIVDLSAKERTACVRTLNCNYNQAGSVSVIVSADETAYASVLRNKAIRESGILSNFLFLEVGNGAPEMPLVIPPEGALDRWQQMITKWCEARITPQNRQHRLYQPDARGLQAYVEFREWVQTEKGFAGPKVAPFLSLLPDLCLQLSLIRTAMSDASENLMIPGECVEQVAESLRRIGRRQRELLERLVTEQPEEELFEQEVGRIVQKLVRHGPLTIRGLARRCHRQDYAKLEPLLEHGLRHGNIRQQGNLFSAPPVSVSASA